MNPHRFSVALLASCFSAMAAFAAPTVQDTPFQSFFNSKADPPTDGTAYPYERAPDLVVIQSLGADGCLVRNSMTSGGKTVFVIPSGAVYANDDFLRNGIYVADGTYTYDSVSGAIQTVRRFREMPAVQAQPLLARIRRERQEQRDREIRREEERKAAIERRKLEEAEEAKREARIREEAKKALEAETAKRRAESERRLAEEQRAADAAAAEARREAELETERRRIADEAKLAEERRVQEERQRMHDAEMAHLRKARKDAEQVRYKDHAEKVLSALKLDPMDYFEVQASFKDKIGEPKIFTKKWTMLRDAQGRRDWLEMLSLLGETKRADYPSPETVDSLVAQFYQTTCRIQFPKSFVPSQAPQICRFFVARSPYMDQLVSPQFRILSTGAFHGNSGNDLFEFKPADAPFVIAQSNAPDFPNFNNIAGMGKGFSEMETAQRALRGEISVDDAKRESIRIVTEAAKEFDRWLESH